MSNLGLFSIPHFQPFPFHSTHKLITKILWHAKNYIAFFASLRKNIGIILIHSHRMAIAVLAVVLFFIWQSTRKDVSAPD